MIALALLKRFWFVPVAILLLWLAWSAWHNRGGGGDARAAAHATAVATKEVARTDTIYRHDTVAYRVAAASFRALRDTLRITDTVQVRTALNRAESALGRCDSTMVSGPATIRARDTLVVKVHDQLVIAERGTSRFGTRASALYDPIAKIPTAAVEGSFRITAKLSAIARVDQRFAPGEHPRAGLGFALTF